MPNESKVRGCTSYKVRQLMRRITQHYDSEVSQAGLRTTQYSLLVQTARLGPVKPVELAKAMMMTASTLSRNLQPLLEAGWIVVAPGENARCHHVSITPAGLAKRDEAQQHWRIAQHTLNERLSVDRVLALHALIEESLDLLGPEAAPSTPATHAGQDV